MTVDVKRAWLNIFRRIQSVATPEAGNHGYAVITLRVVVDSSGRPVGWTEPERVKLEPKGNAQELIALLTGQ